MVRWRPRRVFARRRWAAVADLDLRPLLAMVGPVRRRRRVRMATSRGLWVDEAISVEPGAAAVRADARRRPRHRRPSAAAPRPAVGDGAAVRHVGVRRAAAVADRRRRPRAGDVLGRPPALRPAHRLGRRGARGRRPVRRLVLAGSADVLAVHAARRRSPSAPRCRRSGAAGRGDWALYGVVDGGDAVDAVLRRAPGARAAGGVRRRAVA